MFFEYLCNMCNAKPEPERQPSGPSDNELIGRAKAAHPFPIPKYYDWVVITGRIRRINGEKGNYSGPLPFRFTIDQKQEWAHLTQLVDRRYCDMQSKDNGIFGFLSPGRYNIQLRLEEFIDGNDPYGEYDITMKFEKCCPLSLSEIVVSKGDKKITIVPWILLRMHPTLT